MMGRTAAILAAALLTACWQSHREHGDDVSVPDVDDPGIESIDIALEFDALPDPTDETVLDPVDEETDPCADGYPGEPYGCLGSIIWVSETLEARWIEMGDTLADYCLPNQDDEIVCLGEHFCSSEIDFIVIVLNTYW